MNKHVSIKVPVRQMMSQSTVNRLNWGFSEDRKKQKAPEGYVYKRPGVYRVAPQGLDVKA